MKYLDKLNLQELKELKEYISKFASMGELINELDSNISTKQKVQKENPNIRFDIELFRKLSILEPSEINLLVENNINNLQELIDCDLNALIGITPSIKAKLEWTRQFYDMSIYYKEAKKSKKR